MLYEGSDGEDGGDDGGSQGRRMWNFALKEKFLVICWCLWISNPWIWDNSDFKYSVPLSYHVFHAKIVPLFVWKNRLFSLSLVTRNLAGQP